MEIRTAQYSHIGARDTNEDSCRILTGDGTLLALVADGLGGMDAGEIASCQAVETIAGALQNTVPEEDALYDAVQMAGRAVYENPESSNMRTTVAVLWLREDRAFAANVGDTRIYQFREGRICYQSTDHSMAQMAVLLGKLSPEEIRSSPERNRLVRTLGGWELPKVDVEELEVQPGDRFLLCSDGFWEPVQEQDMLQSLRTAPTPEAWLEDLRGRVLRARNPRQDNHTAIAIMVDSL